MTGYTRALLYERLAAHFDNGREIKLAMAVFVILALVGVLLVPPLVGTVWRLLSDEYALPTHILVSVAGAIAIVGMWPLIMAIVIAGKLIQRSDSKLLR